MIVRIILFFTLLNVVRNDRQKRYTSPRCLTGYMTDVQSWVDDNGNLTVDTKNHQVIDLSAHINTALLLQSALSMYRSNQKRTVRYLSLAKCRLIAVPGIFHLEDSEGYTLSNTVMFLSLYGNQFQGFSSSGEGYNVVINATGAQEIHVAEAFGKQTESIWANGFRDLSFSSLKELDLRACSIQTLSSEIFNGMSSLEALYLAENSIFYVQSRAFIGLQNLMHLDISRNLYNYQNGFESALSWESFDIFSNMPKLGSLDLSFTKLSINSINAFRSLGPYMNRLSICHTGVSSLAPGIFNNTSLMYLDVSGNHGILNDPKALTGIEKSLQVMYADGIGLKLMDAFYSYEKLEVLKISNNEISMIVPKIIRSFTNLKILDMDSNRITTWFTDIIKVKSSIQLLSLRNNNINMITIDMLHDFENINYLALSKNFFICNCHARELIELAANNENCEKLTNISNIKSDSSKSGAKHKALAYHTGFDDFNHEIEKRNIVKNDCRNDAKCSLGKNETCVNDIELESEGNFLLFDYYDEEYECLDFDGGYRKKFYQVELCSMTQRDYIYDDVIKENWNKLIVIGFIPIIILPLLVFGYIFRRNFKYFLITMKNSATLSLIGDSNKKEDGMIYNYDVFVSYCNEDRDWVLDELLPHMEKDCNVSVCLHERDFQVGLSILENIVSCMDRSRSIMLILSKRFLQSQWCQFEMHLAQHRLLETRREDLILVLLEDIPRRFRPTTLHYLMLTKTYIVWPEGAEEKGVFWKRVKKSLVTHKLKDTENVSLA